MKIRTFVELVGREEGRRLKYLKRYICNLNRLRVQDKSNSSGKQIATISNSLHGLQRLRIQMTSMSLKGKGELI